MRMLNKLVVDVASMRGDLGREEVLRMVQGSLGRLLQVMLRMQVRSGGSSGWFRLLAPR
jgi:hypothetical protein